MSRPVLIICFFLLPLTAESQNSAWRPFHSGNNLTLGINPMNPNAVFAEGAGFIVSYDKGITWQTLGPLPAFDLRQILIHPSDTTVIFCIDFSGGLQRSPDYGATWVTVLPDVGIDGESLCLDPVHPDTLYLGNYSDGGVFRSTDRGFTWEFRSSAGIFLCALSVRPDSSNILLAGTGFGTISKSSDGGFTWRMVKEGGSAEIPNIVIDPDNPLIAYGTGYEGDLDARGVWKTTDGGEDWFLTSLADTSLWGMDMDLANPETVYAGLFSAGSGVFKTTNGGADWVLLSAGLPDVVDGWSVKVHPMDPSVLWLAGGSALYRWVPPVATINGVVLDAATGDTVQTGFLSLESTGETVQLDTSKGLFTLNYYEGDPSLSSIAHVEAFPYFVADEPVEFVPDTTIWMTIELDQLTRTSVAGTVEDSVSHTPLEADITLSSTTILGGLTYTTTANPDGSFLIDSVYITYPPIISYDDLTITSPFPHAEYVIQSVVLDSSQFVVNASVDTADVLMTSSEGSGDYTSYYKEALDSLRVSYHYWNPGTTGLAPLSRTAETRKGILIYFTGDDTLSLSQEELDSLSTVLELGFPMFITGQNFVEANAASDLIQQTFGLLHVGNGSVPICRGTDNDLFDGMFFSTAGGNGADNQTSRDIIKVVSSPPIEVLEYGITGDVGTAGVRMEDIGNGSRVVLFGFGFEAINLESAAETVMETVIGYLDGSITVSVDEDDNRIPLTFELGQNYPNPFNATSNFEFGIAQSSFTRFRVYDLLGQEVATLVNETLSPGRYTVQWDAAGIPTGVYFYRLEARHTEGSFVSTRKLVLLK